MSHHAALVDPQLIKNFVDHSGPFWNTARWLRMWRLGSPKSPSAEFLVNLYVERAAALPVNGDQAQPQTLGHLVVHTHYMANATQP
jgi:hypothetical protein